METDFDISTVISFQLLIRLNEMLLQCVLDLRQTIYPLFCAETTLIFVCFVIKLRCLSCVAIRRIAYVFLEVLLFPRLNLWRALCRYYTD